jgi:Prenyltransferase and squalene oxidase repeat
MSADSPNDAVTILLNLTAVGYDALRDDAREEVRAFVANSQLDDGFFPGRDGRPDYYYSLFGVFLCAALGMRAELSLLASRLRSRKLRRNLSPVDRAARALTRRIVLREVGQSVPRSLGLARDFVLFFSTMASMVTLAVAGSARSARRKGSAYAVFIRLLNLAPVSGFTKRPMRSLVNRAGDSVLARTEQITHLAAMAVAKTSLGLDASREASAILSFAVTGGGFSAFRNSRGADLLSTACALCALSAAGAVTGKVAVGTEFARECADYISACYDQGAFVSGDGDPARDLEYTFYGLLGLGSIVGGARDDR